MRRQFLASKIYFASDGVVVEVVVVEILSLIRTSLRLLLQIIQDYLIFGFVLEMKFRGAARRDW